MLPRVARAAIVTVADEITWWGGKATKQPKQRRDKCPKRTGVAEVAPIRSVRAPIGENISKIRIANYAAKTILIHA